jgi:hypothetical protein
MQGLSSRIESMVLIVSTYTSTLIMTWHWSASGELNLNSVKDMGLRMQYIVSMPWLRSWL